MASQKDAKQKLDQLRERFNQLSASFSDASLDDLTLLEESNEQLQVLIEELSVANEELALQNEELLQTRESVEKERERYQDLFEFAPDGYLLTNRFGKILEANRAAALLVNVSQETLLGKTIAQFVAPEERKAFRLRLAKFHSALVDAEIAPIMNPAERRGFRRLAEDWEIQLLPHHGPPFSVILSAANYLNGQEGLLRWSIRNITERKLAQKALQASERKFKTLAEVTSVAIFLVHEGKISYANPSASQTTGYANQELVGREFRSLIHPDERDLPFLKRLEQGAANEVSQSAASERRQIRLLTSGSEECWVDLSLGVTDLDDKTYWVITAYDITRAIRADRTQKDLLRWLVTVQEEERRRISRELHDQMGQDLTALTLGLKSLEHEIIVAGPGLERLKQLKRLTYELGEEVHRVAFELRPTSLDDLGLRSSLNNYIEEWSERSGIRVEFETTGLKDGAIASPVATSIFRIVQEALNNVMKHSGASRVSLIFDHRPGDLRVIVEDNGCGFNVEKLQQTLGGVRRLGLLGMQERAELVGGTFVVESETGKGTTVYVNIPLTNPDRKEAGNDDRSAADLPG